MNEPASKKPYRLAIAAIMVAVLAWGAFHAVGAYRYNHNPMRAVMVIGCVLAFLAFWGVMLAARRARQ